MKENFELEVRLLRDEQLRDFLSDYEKALSRPSMKFLWPKIFEKRSVVRREILRREQLRKPDFFNRCTYDVVSKNGDTVHKVYIVRNSGGGEAAIDATIEMVTRCQNKDLVFVTERRRHGDFLPYAVVVRSKSEPENPVMFCRFSADHRTYTFEELAENPGLLPDNDVEGFRRAYGYHSQGRTV